MEGNYVITIARGFGTGGKVIAQTLADELGIPCYEHRILTFAAQLAGEDESKFVKHDERLSTKSIANIFHNITRSTKIHPEGRFISDDNIFDYQKQIIEQLADTESCIIVGKCADWILKDRKNVISVYIEAPRRYCLKRIESRMNVSEEEANRLISSTDKYRADYYHYYTQGNNWTNPVNYDLTLNSERVGHDNCIKVIKDYIKIKFGE
ncbi:MAG: AAA family ATPase [Lachnospiraceae bacterium]